MVVLCEKEPTLLHASLPRTSRQTKTMKYIDVNTAENGYRRYLVCASAAKSSALLRQTRCLSGDACADRTLYNSHYAIHYDAHTHINVCMQQNFDVNMRKRTHTRTSCTFRRKQMLFHANDVTQRTERVGISMEAAAGITDHCSSYAFDVVYSFNQNQPPKHFVQRHLRTFEGTRAFR